eukprot:16388832-Heterocapsa_arctica.AAC.1
MCAAPGCTAWTARGSGSARCCWCAVSSLKSRSATSAGSVVSESPTGLAASLSRASRRLALRGSCG